MQRILGTLLVILGLAGGFYISMIYCFVGGMKDLIHFAQSGYLAYNLLAIGVFKLFGVTISGVVMGFTCVDSGLILIKNSK